MGSQSEDFLADLFAPFGSVTIKRMFGGLGLFHEGLMIAIAGDEGIFLKVDENNRPDFEAAGSEPFGFQRDGKQRTMSYWRVPETLMDEPEEFADWARGAYGAAVRAKAGKR